MTLRIAMWSGPRNISTAMMRAWENRPDCAVIDEPLYGFYLHKTGLNHPGAKEVMDAQGVDWQTAVSRCLQTPTDGEAVLFQKHMIMHLLDEVPRDWLRECRHMFLIRKPADVIASYSVVRDSAILEDLGYPQMAGLFKTITEQSGQRPLVINADAFLQNPEQHLRKMCTHLSIDFHPEMLNWPVGKRDSDGVWAPYWYSSVEASSGFAPYTAKQAVLDEQQQNVVEQATPLYESMAQWAMFQA